MSTFVIICALTFVAYELGVYSHFQRRAEYNDVQKASEPTESIADEADIIGKSTFDVNAELRRIRQEKEEIARKEAIAKGEMTEDGKEIAQEVKPEDCEIETKKVIVQVPDEELDDMFSEQDVPRANGDIINDIDLKFGANRRDLDEEEERRISENMYKALDETILLDDICNLAPEIGREIRRMIDKYKKEMSEAIKQVKTVESIKPLQRKFTMAERYADINIEDLV